MFGAKNVTLIFYLSRKLGTLNLSIYGFGVQQYKNVGNSWLNFSFQFDPLKNETGVTSPTNAFGTAELRRIAASALINRTSLHLSYTALIQMFTLR